MKTGPESTTGPFELSLPQQLIEAKVKSRQMVFLPIFPLNVVLFPTYRLPLRIFEPRYRRMLDDCLAGDGRFCIALIREGVEVGGEATPREIATVARIEDVGDRSAEVITLVAIGEQRVRIGELDRSLPYLAGQVEPIDEPTEADIDPELLERARAAATRLARAMLMQIRGEWRANPDLPDDPAELGYRMGTLLADRPTAAQRVLEASSLSERLRQAAPAVEAAAARYEAALLQQASNDPRRGLQRN